LFSHGNLINLIVSASSDDASGEGYKEELIPMEYIPGTKLYTGLVYRLHHEYFGNAPVVASEYTNFFGYNFHYWKRLPYWIVAERRQSEWPQYR
jgi:hypothetical protein